MESRDTTPWVRALRSRDRFTHAVAQVELCAFYEPLVKAMAQRYRQTTPGAEIEELEQVARLAVVEACSTFDAKRWRRRKDGLGRLFTQHAVWSVRHALSKYLTSLPNPVRLPSVVMDRLPKMRREAVRLAHELGREPTIEELAKATGMPGRKYRKCVEEMIALMYEYDNTPFSYGGPMDHVIELTLANTQTPEDIVIAKEELKALRRQRSAG